MKFRCERDVLAEAVGAADRATTSRGGTLPVLAGIRMEVVGDQLTIVGTDLELTIRLQLELGDRHVDADVFQRKLVQLFGLLKIVTRQRQNLVAHKRFIIFQLGFQLRREIPEYQLTKIN